MKQIKAILGFSLKQMKTILGFSLNQMKIVFLEGESPTLMIKYKSSLQNNLLVFPKTTAQKMVYWL